MEESSPPRTLGRLKAALGAERSAHSRWPAGIDTGFAIAVIVAVVGGALWESQAVAVGAGLLMALGLFLAGVGLSSLRVARGDPLAAVELAADCAPAPDNYTGSCFAAATLMPAQSDGEPDAAELAQRCAQLEAANESLRASEAFGQSLFDARPEQVAVLDENGTIIAVNAAWKRCAAESGLPDPLGCNYLRLCEAAAGDPEDEYAAAAFAGLRTVLAGESGEFRQEYPCQSAGQARWFAMRIYPLRGARRGALVAHEDISRRKSEEDALLHSAAIVRRPRTRSSARRSTG